MGYYTYGEFVMVYYNKDMFAQYGLNVPTTLEEFEQICDTFVANGIIPIHSAGADQWPATQLVRTCLYNADRELANTYQMVAADVDLKGPAFRFGTEKFIEYINKGYFDPNATGIDYDTSHPGFYAEQKYPMMLTGSWLYKVVIDNAVFDWDVFLMPGKTLNTGSGGNLFIVPENAKHKELAYDYLDFVLSEEAQTVMAEAGGIPLSADLAAIEDPKTQRLNELFNGLVKNDGLAFYPDWPREFYGSAWRRAAMLLSGSADADGFRMPSAPSMTVTRNKRRGRI